VAGVPFPPDRDHPPRRRVVLAGYALGGALFLVPRLWGGTYYDPYQRLPVALFFAFVVLEQNFCVGSPGKASRLPLVTRLGRYTYGLYLLHAIVLTLITRAARGAGFSEGGLWYRLALGPVGLACSIGLAVASYHLFESRFLHLKDRFTHVPSAAVAALRELEPAAHDPDLRTGPRAEMSPDSATLVVNVAQSWR